MEAVLVKSLGFIFIIFIGYMLKRRGFFKKEDGIFLSKIIMNITLPGALISGASGMSINSSAIILIIAGFFSNLFLLYFSKYVNYRKSPMDKAVSMISCTGYNVGNFAIPFAASFFEPTALVYMCMFDIGNSFMVLGGAYAFGKNELEGNGRINIKNLFKVVFKSFPFDVYIFLFFLSILDLSVPKQIISIASMIGSANGFLAMLMIGIMLEINISKEQAKSVVKLLGTRYVSNVIIAVMVYFLIPLPILAKKMIIIILFAPLSTVSAVYCKMIDPDNPTPALANSISILVSICVMIGLLVLFI